MLTEEHFELFKEFRIKAMGDKLREIVDDASYDSCTFEEKMEMLLDAEADARRTRKVEKKETKADTAKRSKPAVKKDGEQ